MAEAAASFSVLEWQVDALLREWGEWQRREQSPAPAWYPSASVEGRMMSDWGSREKRMRRIYRRGRMTCKQTQSLRVSPQWPAIVAEIDSIIAGMPVVLAKCTKAYYLRRESEIDAAAYLGISRDMVHRRLLSARGYVTAKIGYLFD